MAKNICVVAECNRISHSRGWCKMHYLRLYRTGSVGPAQPYSEIKHQKPLQPVGRVAVLAEAAKIVSQDRNSAYGEPEDNFGRIAALWSAWLGIQITNVDVAALLLLVKVARLQATPNHVDSWVDIAGYAACGAEVANR